MSAFLKMSPKLYPLFTAARNITDDATRKAFEEYTSILLDAFSNEDLADEISTIINNNSLLGVSYAVSQGTWTRVAGHGSYVSCRAASDPIGTLTSDATTFNVYLPRSSQDKDPCVYSGDILQYIEVSSVKYAVGESYLSDRIGVVKGITHTDIPNGWEICDGGGSIPDFVGKFLRGAATYGGSGGSDTHGHTGSVTIDSASPSISGTTGTTSLSTGAAGGTTGSSTTGITIGDHPDHTHNVTGFCQNAADDGATYWHATGESVVAEAGGGATHSITDAGHTHSVGSHTHAISPDPHSHSAGSLAVAAHTHTGSISINSSSNVPVYADMIYIIRVGPSGEIS